MGRKPLKKAAKKGKNPYSVTANVGRPRVYKSPEKMAAVCEEYFMYILGEYEEVKRRSIDDEGNIKEWTEVIWHRHPEPMTITGLALYLGFSDRTTIYDYEKRPEFAHIIKRAMARVENGYENRLQNDKPVGAIFALKNMNWRDKQETVLSDPDGKGINFVPPVIKINVVPPKEDLE